jgi:hypothetical protein
MDGGEGRSSPLSPTPLPHCFGGYGKRPRTGGRGKSLGAYGLARLLRGAGLQSLVAASDEEFMGCFAGIASYLISLCKNTKIPIYIRIEEALEV